jgi:hypothetical protein
MPLRGSFEPQTIFRHLEQTLNVETAPLPARSSRGEGMKFGGPFTQGGAPSSLTLGCYHVIPPGFSLTDRIFGKLG